MTHRTAAPALILAALVVGCAGLPADEPRIVAYACEGGTRLEVRFDGDDVWLMLGGHENRLRRVPDTRRRYADADMAFWTRGERAWLEIDGRIAHAACRSEA